jgi:hypothetical protein
MMREVHYQQLCEKGFICRECILLNCPKRSAYPAGQRGLYMHHLRIWQDLSDPLLRMLAMKVLGEEIDRKYLCCIYMDTQEAIPIVCRTFVKEFDECILSHNAKINSSGEKQIVYVAFKRLVSSATIDTVIAFHVDDWEESDQTPWTANKTPEELVELINAEATAACTH